MGKHSRPEPELFGIPDANGWIPFKWNADDVAYGWWKPAPNSDGVTMPYIRHEDGSLEPAVPIRASWWVRLERWLRSR